jgi:hypothetical protein
VSGDEAAAVRAQTVWLDLVLLIDEAVVAVVAARWPLPQNRPAAFRKQTARQIFGYRRSGVFSRELRRDSPD